MKNLNKYLSTFGLAAALWAGVVMGAWGQEMCSIQGTDGVCSVSRNAYTQSEMQDCGKYQTIQYVGTCKNGLLEGVALLNESTVVNGAPSRWVLLSSFNAGNADNPSVTFGKQSIGYTDGASRNSGICFYWEGSQIGDVRRTKPYCIQAAEKYIEDVMDKAFWEKAFNRRIAVNQLPKLRASGRLSAPNQIGTTRDDPKVFGRGARGG